MVILLQLKVSKANSDSCSASKSTVQSVPECPTDEAEWRKASQRKNCSAYASKCSDPDKLVYHCVINPFLNETVEVCAYKKIIVFGYCTEYSYSANRVQQSAGVVCTGFTQNPCPTGYPSNEAYKYPGCYELTKRPTTENPATMIPSTSDTTALIDTVSMLKGSAGDSEDKLSIGSIIGIVIGVLFIVAALVLAGLFIYRRYLQRREGHHPFPASDIQSCANEKYPSTAVEDRNSEERTHLVPSGAEAGIKMKNIEKVDDEQPVNLVKPEKEVPEENDCQILVNLLSDGLERFAILQSEHNSEDNKEGEEKLRVIASKIYENSEHFSNENPSTIHEHITELESLERYFQRPKVKKNVYLPPE